MKISWLWLQLIQLSICTQNKRLSVFLQTFSFRFNSKFSCWISSFMPPASSYSIWSNGRSPVSQDLHQKSRAKNTKLLFRSRWRLYIPKHIFQKQWIDKDGCVVHAAVSNPGFVRIFGHRQSCYIQVKLQNCYIEVNRQICYIQVKLKLWAAFIFQKAKFNLRFRLSSTTFTS